MQIQFLLGNFKNIKKLNERGYSGDELKIKFHKYLSLPIYLFSMIILSNNFYINIKKNYSNFIYIFFGIILGIIIYFLNDLSIALGISGKIPLSNICMDTNFFNTCYKYYKFNKNK
jgi:lipopolysaccharide export LptBFGC system permease protein LptF